MGITLEEALAQGAKPHGMTLEEAMAAGGREHRESKYPAPKSFTASDEEMGLSFGPASSDVPGDQQARLSGGLDVAAPELSPVEKSLKGPYDNDIEFLKEAAPFAAGGALGKGASMLLGKAAIAPGEQAVNALQKWLTNNFMHGKIPGLVAEIAPKATALAGSAAAGATRSGMAGAAGALPAAAGVGGAAVAPGVVGNGSEDEVLRKVARMLMGGQPLGNSPTFPQGE